MSPKAAHRYAVLVVGAFICGPALLACVLAVHLVADDLSDHAVFGYGLLAALPLVFVLGLIGARYRRFEAFVESIARRVTR